MGRQLNLVNASAGKRLAAWLLDSVPVVIAMLVFGAVNASTIARASVSSAAAGSLVASYLVLVLFLLVYGVALWWWEAKTGKTLGNVALGLRTSDEDGFAPGWGKVFLRRLLVGVAGIVPVAGPVVVLVSNLWDSNHQRQGWHDKAAKTLVVDVNQGRDPITTGGLFGPSTFAPGGATAPHQPGHPHYVPAPATQWPALSPEFGGSDGGPISSIPGASPQGSEAGHGTTGAPAPGGAPAPADASRPGAAEAAGAPLPANPASAHASQTHAAAHASQTHASHTHASPAHAPQTHASAAHAPAGQQRPAYAGSAGTPAGAALSGGHGGSGPLDTAAYGDSTPSHPDDDAGQTQLRNAAPAATGARLVFDDGQVLDLRSTALIGRNPAALEGERVADLFPFADMGRSVSKTHLHLVMDSSGVWVTDRNSTNGTGITAAGQRRQLVPGEAQRAGFGDTVHFGDRSFKVERA